MENKKHEIWALCAFTGTLLLFFSLVSFHPTDLTIFNASGFNKPPQNWVGTLGAHLSWCLFFLFGITSLCFPLFGFRITCSLLLGSPVLPNGRVQAVGLCLVLLVVMTFFSIHWPRTPFQDGEVSTGGQMGLLMARWLMNRLYFAGTHILLLGAFFIGLLLSTPMTLASISQRISGLLRSWLQCLQKFSWRSVSKAENVPVDSTPSTSPRKMSRGSSPAVRKPANGSTRPGHQPGNAEGAAKPLPVQNPPPLPSAKPLPPVALPSVKPGEYVLPPFDLLESYEAKATTIDRAELQVNARVLQEKLADFGVQGEVLDILPGPVITMYEYAPAPGIKISRIVSLSDDLAMALKAVSIRVVAPIPGKAAIGIELPNKDRELVAIRDVLESKAFADSPAPLTIILGKGITGAPTVANLARMPHLLIAGATGTGKSVGINALLTSLLYRNTPDDLRLLLIDPKRIELSSYEGIPHLVHPVVTDAKRATRALKWAVQEMELRYKLLADKNVRNIEGYNKALAHEKSAGTGRTPSSQSEDGAILKHHRLPYIVIIIDELADLMMVASREVEESIIRLAQMARACGIHLILATQRPSVDVLTGIIKANIPTRISFQVSSKIDSRTILDGSGAEALLGSGDMLFLPPGTAKLQRIHGAFVSDAEVQRLTEFWRVQQLHEDPLSERVDFEEKAGDGGADPDELDEKYEEAVQLVVETRQASISMLQRRLRVGYNRAARMIEIMEQQGIVGASDGVKPREVLRKG